MRLEHVGSTAVPGLAAKPVIDACIVVTSRRDMPYVVKARATLAYLHHGDLGVPDREALRAPTPDNSAPLPKHHLYASPRHSLSLRNHLGLRDALRAQPELAADYGTRKQALAREFPGDIDRYIAGKATSLWPSFGKRVSPTTDSRRSGARDLMGHPFGEARGSPPPDRDVL